MTTICFNYIHVLNKKAAFIPDASIGVLRRNSITIALNLESSAQILSPLALMLLFSCCICVSCLRGTMCSHRDSGMTDSKLFHPDMAFDVLFRMLLLYPNSYRYHLHFFHI